MKALEVSGLCRKYGDRKVLDNLSFALEPGRFEALMGPSGSGKSTFLHLVAGLLSADAGEILVGGKNVARMSDAQATKFRRRHVGVVFQAFNLLGERTVRENILLPLALDGAAKGEAVAGRLDTLARALGIADRLEDRAGELSGGEQQRVAIARALIAEPDIVLADEPTGNLDARSAKAICALLASLGRASSSALLVVTHDPQVAACAQRVHFLKDGAVAASCETAGDAARISQLYLETYR